MPIINISHDYCVPNKFRFLGVISIVFSITLITQTLTLSGVMISAIAASAGLLMLTARYGLLLDAEQHRYKEYVRLLFYKNGQWVSYASIEKIFINKLRASHTMTRTGARFDTAPQIYQAYLKFDNGKKIKLDSDSNKEHLLFRLGQYNERLKTIIQENAL